MNPYIMQMQQSQDLGGLSPYLQNIAQQQAMQNMAIQQGQGLTQAAGQIGQGGNDNMALAAMLRKQDPTKPAPITDYSQMMPNSDPAYNNLF